MGIVYMKFKEFLYEENGFIPNFKIMHNSKTVVTFNDLLSGNLELKTAIKKYALENEWSGSEYNSLMNTKPDQNTLNGAEDMMGLGSLFFKRPVAALVHFTTLAPYDTHFESFTSNGKEILINVNDVTHHIEITSSGHYKITQQPNKHLNLKILEVLGKYEFTMKLFYPQCKKYGYEKAKEQDQFKHSNLSAWVLFG